MCTKIIRVFSYFLFIAFLFSPVQSSGEAPRNIKNYKLDKYSKSLKLQQAKFPEMNASALAKMKKSLMLQKANLKEMKKSHRRIDPRVRKHISDWKAGITTLKSKISKSREQKTEKVRLVLKLKDETAGLSHNIEKYGGRIIRKRRNLLAVEVPVDKIEQLVEENDAIVRARFPFKLYPHGDVSEGVGVSNADIFHDTVYDGSGVKVAVIDVGFMGLAAAISNGDLPQDAETYDFSGLGLETEYVHGTACAEVIHDVAPGAKLYLVKVGDETDNWEIMDYCVENDIDIISMSLGTFGSGPGDGTGDFDEVFDEIREAGILAVVSAGNQGNSVVAPGTEDEMTLGFHYEESFDPGICTQQLLSLFGYLVEFHWFINTGAEESSYDYNVVAALPYFKDDGTPEDDEVTVVLRWDDDWPGAAIDYDMVLLEFFPDKVGTEEDIFGDLVGLSMLPQDGSEYSIPLEWISFDLSGSGEDIRYYAVGVVKKCSDPDLEFEIHLGGTSAFMPMSEGDGAPEAIATSTGSVTEPADAESVLAVGAIDYANWTTGPQEDFSSQGPTNDWNWRPARIKPDIMGADGVTTFAYTNLSGAPFYGTSAAAPHVAGMAALFLSMDPDMTADELQDVLEENAVDMGGTGKDNIYGWGRIEAADDDNDDMFDMWETEYGLNTGTNDADGDLDGDGFSNIDEFKAGTLPNDAQSKPSRFMPWLPLLLDDE